MRPIDEDRLVDYFAGELAEEEARRVAAWIREDPARQTRVEALRQLWDAAGQPRPSRFDADAMWGRLEARMERETAPPLRASPRPLQRRVSPSRSAKKQRAARVVGGAVLIAAVVLLAVALFEAGPARGPSERAMREIATEAGQRVRVRLSDDTQIVLNAKSTLRLPAAFADDKREVHLEGEAYFEVAPDAQRPFLVHASGVTTQVLGTAFNVGAYPEDDAVQVVVAEGRVAVRADRSASGATGAQAPAPEEAEDEVEDLVLGAHQMGRLSASGERVVRQNVDVSAYTAWTRGRLVFKDASFDEVARKLAQWYDLRVRLADPSVKVDRLNATFEDESVSEMLDVIAQTLSLRYERDQKTVTFLRAGPPAP